jgi:hypothetical protein
LKPFDRLRLVVGALGQGHFRNVASDQKQEGEVRRKSKFDSGGSVRFERRKKTESSGSAELDFPSNRDGRRGSQNEKFMYDDDHIDKLLFIGERGGVMFIDRGSATAGNRW